MKKALPFLLVLLLLCCASCDTDTTGKSESSSLNTEETKALVYRSDWVDKDSVTATLISPWDTSYCFILTPEGELVTITGMASAHHEAGDSVTADDYAVKELSEKEQKTIYALRDSLGAFKGDDSNASDVWYVSYYAGGAEYHFNYGGSVNDNYDKLIAEMIAYSALPVVDTHGEAVSPCTD